MGNLTDVIDVDLTFSIQIESDQHLTDVALVSDGMLITFYVGGVRVFGPVGAPGPYPGLRIYMLPDWMWTVSEHVGGEATCVSGTPSL